MSYLDNTLVHFLEVYILDNKFAFSLGIDCVILIFKKN